jgi:hypothetical protein
VNAFKQPERKGVSLLLGWQAKQGKLCSSPWYFTQYFGHASVSIIVSRFTDFYLLFLLLLLLLTPQKFVSLNNGAISLPLSPLLLDGEFWKRVHVISHYPNTGLSKLQMQPVIRSREVTRLHNLYN